MKIEYILVVIGILALLGAGFLYFQVNNANSQNGQQISQDPCLFGNLKLCDVNVPNNVKVEYKAALSPEMLNYYSKGELYVFHSCVEGGRVENNYKIAQMKVADDISNFLGQVVRSTSALIKNGSSEFYSRAVNVISNNVVVGMIILAKYHYVDPPLDKYCVIAFYNPREALKIMKNYTDLLSYLKKSNVNQKDFEKLFMENAKKLYSIYGR